MIINKSPLVLREILVLIVLFGYSVNGNEKLATQCANQGEPCDEHQQDPCCDNNFVCKRAYGIGQSKCTKKAKLDDSCRINEDCSDILHSKCSTANKCVCRPNNIPVNNTNCAPLLNEFCWKNEKCAPANSICLDNECKCRNGYLPKSNNQCIPKVLGAFCKNDTTCAQIKFAKCSSQNICVCTSNTIASSPILCSPLLEEPCESKYECGVTNSMCIDNKCQCESQYIPYSNTACKIPYLGMPCMDDTHCQKSINYTICNRENECVCNYGYFPKSDHTCGREFNAQCFPDEPCTTNNTICLDNICQCKTNYVFRKRKCVPKHLNEPCETSTDCAEITFAECSEEKTCRCKDQYFAFNETNCALSIGGQCFTDKDCDVKHSSCWFGQCLCQLGYIAISDGKCISSEINRSCVNDHDCILITNAKCSKNHRCVCKTNHVKTDVSECAPLLNEACINDEQCVPDNSVCIHNKCQCKFSYLQRSINKCVLSYLYKNCTRDEDCSEIPFAKCSDANKCICHSNYVQLNLTTCAPLLGGFCTEHAECKAKNSICLDNECVCSNSYSPRAVDECVPIFLGQYCRSDKDCDKISNSECSEDNKCICKSNHSQFDSVICLPLIGGHCNEHKECLVYNSNCNNSVCQCLENYKSQSKQECVSNKLDKICYNHFDCYDIMNSHCSRHNLCVCNPNYIAVKGNMCAPQLNALCTETTTCMTNNSTCIDNKCQCKPKYVSNSYNQCVPTYLGEFCYEDEDCIEIRNSKCFDRKCICKKNYFSLNNKKCAAFLKSYCTIDADCIVANSICVSNHCQCKFGYSTIFNHTCKPTPLGKSCEKDEDCEYIENSICSVNKICVCDVNYYALNKYTCVASLNAHCLKDEECHMDFSFCSNNICKCKPNTAAISSNQCMMTRLLYSCNSTSECAEPWHEQCSKDKKCVCKENNIALSLSSCLPILGGICWKDGQCAIENSVCDDYRCVCRHNYKPVSNNMCLQHTQ
ncbi:prion-like-(Q/N-rich) domain-bearing protein 25 isoform X2 [Microplitis demolitor]|uniref:prion-like-(Q/N-rich) domain-bearing protein 25 isoform X2 n=1 Tax=Microplitis demolitor TaxID=69319 RepID=UPI0004CD42AD|nr:prion-like-(Q/N-rich) domain-bearing protein 25 isoform X2 [Microplitis demolitor]